MKKISWFGLSTMLLVLIFCMPSCNNSIEKENSVSASFNVEHVVMGYIGENHLANLVYRNGINGGSLVGWGRYPLTEWPNLGASTQRQRVEAEGRYSNGGCAMDITGDGIDEIITARGEMSNLANATLLWFQEVEGDDYWEEHEIASIWPGGYSSPHDIVPYIKKTESGEEFKAVLANKSRREMHMFVVPEDPKQDEWPHYVIAEFPVNNASGLKLADINGDGNMDIVAGNFWLEAPDDPTDVPWTIHRFCEWDEMGENNFGGMNYHVVEDFNGDGFLDMVVVEAEIPDSRISLFLRSSDDGTGLWEEILLEGGIDVPHSLVAVDLNNNDRMDIIVGEMTAGGWSFPYNPNPKLYAYINTGGGEFEKQIIYEGWGVHEMRLYPELYEGKIMVYGADEIQPHKFINMNTHVSYWLISYE